MSIESAGVQWLIERAQEFLSSDIDHMDVSADHDTYRSHATDERRYDEHYDDGSYDRWLLQRLEYEFPGIGMYLTGNPDEDLEMIENLLWSDVDELRRLDGDTARDIKDALRSLGYQADKIKADGVVERTEFESFTRQYLNLCRAVREDLGVRLPAHRF